MEEEELARVLTYVVAKNIVLIYIIENYIDWNSEKFK